MRERLATLVALFAYSTCGIAYELLLAAFAGYVLGESLLLFAAIVGLFLSSMGLGAHLSRRVADPVFDVFVGIGIALAVTGALAPLAIFVAAAQRTHTALAIGVMTAACGLLTGLAIPLAARLLQGPAPLSRLLSALLAADYAGALAGSLLLPLAILPGAGFLRGAALLGCACVAAAGGLALAARPHLRARAALGTALAAGALLCVTAALHGDRAFDWAFRRLTGEEVVYRAHSPYQEILLSEGDDGLTLRLNGRIQVGEQWERRYHEALVHPALSLAAPPVREVLVLGGGDGLALREIYRYPEVRRVTLVDLDPEMVALARSHPKLHAWNEGSLDDPRVRVVHDDAFLYVQRATETFDAVIVDLPVPVSLSLSKLYSAEFYRNVRRRVRPGGMIAVQSTAFDPSRARVLWCIARTLGAAGLHARPYVVGRMGFNLAAPRPFEPARLTLGVKLAFLTTEFARGLFVLPRDLGPLAVEVNRLESHAILRYMR